ncbi:MAG TPA: hypothetical protein VFQ29_06695 [Methyloceanibacter sp.]|jgi:hypothetical protein|nr:hypothetical protein [Methyloceanibacter sp.]
MTEFLHRVVFVLSLVFLLAIGLHGLGCEVPNLMSLTRITLTSR